MQLVFGFMPPPSLMIILHLAINLLYIAANEVVKIFSITGPGTQPGFLRATAVERDRLL
jgi:hypothetical protein